MLFNLQKIKRIGTNMKSCIKTSKHIAIRRAGRYIRGNQNPYIEDEQPTQ